MISRELKERALCAAREKGVSFGEYVRRAIEHSLEKKTRNGRKAERDVLFLDTAVYRGGAPADLAKKHDAYLYD